MNKVILMGRLTADPEVRYSGSGKDAMTVANYTLAVDRRNKKSEESADFIRCVSFDKGAEFVEKYFEKGQRVAVVGRLETGSYQNKEGVTVYFTNVVVESQEFADSKKAEPEKEPAKNQRRR